MLYLPGGRREQTAFIFGLSIRDLSASNFKVAESVGEKIERKGSKTHISTKVKGFYRKI